MVKIVMMNTTIIVIVILSCVVALTTARMLHQRKQHELDQGRIEAFKTSILQRMGLEHEPETAPNITLQEQRSKLRLYRRSVQEIRGRIHDVTEEEDKNLLAKQFDSFKARGRVSGDGLRLRVPVEIEQPADANRETTVHSATLHLYQLVTHLASMVDSGEQQVRVDVYQLLARSPRRRSSNTNTSSSPRTPRRLLDSKLITLHQQQQQWHDFDVSDALTDWLNDADSNFGLEITCSSGHALNDVITFSLSGQRRPPRISLYTQETQIVGRTRRSIDRPETYDCRQGDGEKRCCRYPIWISFKDIGWDKWVVQPDGYQAYFCDGTCPHSYKVAHNFASIKSLINLANPAVTPGPCCTASKLSPLTLLHYNGHGQLVVTVYDDMIVEQCKCA